MKVLVDQNTCTGYGLCVDTIPAVFEMDGDTVKVKVDVVSTEAATSCQEAVDGCPVEAISIAD